MKPTLLAVILAISATAATACQQPLNVCDDQDPERTVDRPVDRDNPFDPPVDKPEPTPEPPLDDGREGTTQ